MNVSNVFFAFCAIVSVLGAVGTVLAKNPIRGAIGLLATVIGIAGLFLELEAQFLAAIQLIVYAGAVVVLFVFVIMLLGPDAGATAPDPKAEPARALWSRWLAGALLAILALGTGISVAMTDSTPTPFQPAPEGHGSVEAVGKLLFGAGTVPFELATALLIVAVIGAIAVARARHTPSRTKRVQSPARMFGGPIHPRDAGHPLPKEGLP